MSLVWLEARLSITIPSFVYDMFLATVFLLFWLIHLSYSRQRAYGVLLSLVLAVCCFVAWFVISIPLVIVWHIYLGGTL